MEIGEMLGRIKKELENEYLIPINCVRIDDHFPDIRIRISECQTKDLEIGFDLIIYWRRFELVLSWPSPFIPIGIYEKWHARINENRIIFFWYYSKLKELGNELVFQVNKNKVENFENIPKQEWVDFQLRWKSGFTEIQSGMDLNYERIKDHVLLFWGLILSFAGDTVYEKEIKVEGKSYITNSTQYERNPINRKACLEIHGYSCFVCGILMKDAYGEIGERYIEVHHIQPISSYKEARCIDPSVDLIPVCPNCHSMLHRRNPPYSVDELRSKLKNIKR